MISVRLCNPNNSSEVTNCIDFSFEYDTKLLNTFALFLEGLSFYDRIYYNNKPLNIVLNKYILSNSLNNTDNIQIFNLIDDIYYRMVKSGCKYYDLDNLDNYNEVSLKDLYSYVFIYAYKKVFEVPQCKDYFREYLKYYLLGNRKIRRYLNDNLEHLNLDCLE